jgi:hypothetical protein
MVPIYYIVFHQLDGLTADNTLQTIKNLTSKAGGLSPGEITSFLDIVDKIVDVTNLTNGKIEKKVGEILIMYIFHAQVLGSWNFKKWLNFS